MNLPEMTLIFPPVQNFAMPYLSLPLLKRYIEDNTPIKCNIIDFNQKFFNDIINYEEMGEIFHHKNLHESNLSINNAIKQKIYSDKQIDTFLESHPNYTLSLRKLRTPFNLTDSESIYQGLHSSDNFFHDIFSDYLTDQKFKKTQLFGISIGVEDQIFPSFTLAKVIKTLFPTSKIVIGGNIVTRLYTNILESKLSQFIDFLIVNEGEEALVELAKYQILGEIEKISNPKIIVTKVAESQIRIDDRKKFITQIEKINTPDFREFDLNRYYSPIPILPIFLTRKCSWAKCDFCSIHTSWDPKHRERTIEKVLNDLELYVGDGINHFRIVDEDCKPSTFERFSNGILERDIDIFFEAYSRFEKKFLDLDFCNKIAESGCRQLFFGLESVGENTLNLISKRKKCENYRDFIDKILENTNKAGIVNYIFVMTGIPNTSIEEELETVSYIINNENIHAIALGSFVVDKDSPIHTNENVRNKYNIQLFGVGDMTTEIGFTIDGKDVREQTQNRTVQYAQDIYNSRPDLALASLIDDEVRFILACRFGNKFAQEFISSSEKNQAELFIKNAIKQCSEERIKRKLGENTLGNT